MIQSFRLWLDRNPTLRYVLPFALFFFFLWLSGFMPLNQTWEAPVRVLVLGAVCVLCWPPTLALKPSAPGLSILLGIAVFMLWIAPDVLFSNYRELFPFNNSIVGHAHSSLPSGSLASPWVLFWRFARAVAVVPFVEELFWRGWMMRWIVNSDFETVPLGAYSRSAFLVVAVLFAAEHGPYWDVGLLTGFIFNWWMIRTKSLSDCILVHAVTNACLSAYVIWAGQWQYWQ